MKKMFHLNLCWKYFLDGENLNKICCHSLQFLQMYFGHGGRLSWLCDRRPQANPSPYLLGLHNHFAATDPQTVLVLNLKFSCGFFLPSPNNSCVLHLLGFAEPFKIWIYISVWRHSDPKFIVGVGQLLLAYWLPFGKEHPQSHRLLPVPFFFL